MWLFNLLSNAGANTGGDAGKQQTNPMGLILMGVMIVGIIVLFFFSSRSNKKKQKQAMEMVSKLKVGDRVKTIGGICGFVVEINDGENTFVLETGCDDKKSYVKLDRGAIYQTAPNQGNAVEPKQEDKPKKEEKAKKEDDESCLGTDEE